MHYGTMKLSVLRHPLYFQKHINILNTQSLDYILTNELAKNTGRQLKGPPGEPATGREG